MRCNCNFSLKNIQEKIKGFMGKEHKLTVVAAILSVYTMIAYHFPFFREVFDNIEADFNGALITVGLGVVMLALNFFLYYLFLFLGRTVGKVILAITFLIDALCFYFIVTYNTLLTDQMMGNVFNTQFSEASGFFSWLMLLYVIVLGGIPCVFLFTKKVEYGSWKRFFANIGIALGAILVAVGANYNNILWVDRCSTELGALLMPQSYVVNSIRYSHAVKRDNREEIPLPDARIANDSKDVLVLIIGESARKANFSLYGYERKTNPLLEQDDITVLDARSADTYTRAGVKAILDHKPGYDLYEILPNYLNRTGVDVTWRTSNWGEPKVRIEKYYTVPALQERYPEADGRYDGILLEGLKEEIMASESDKVLVIIHTSTSHGPTYNTKYPAEFETFTPVCETVEVAKSDLGELVNAYDNSIIYTDWLVHNAIEQLREITDRRCCMMYVSDHGESLGENNLFMHGVPLMVAPDVQVEIPFIVWTSDKSLEIDDSKEVGQYHVFHTVLSFLGIESPVYDRTMDLFSSKE